jgi:hypothetical protein
MTTTSEDVPELALVLHLPPRSDASPDQVIGRRGGSALVVLGQFLLLLGCWLFVTGDATGRGAGGALVAIGAAVTVAGIVLRLRAELDAPR